MESCKCCVHCRGDTIARDCDELHEDWTPFGRVSNNPSSSGKHAPGCPRFRRNSEEKQNEIASCYDKFALAKRLHAENLQHQPLPDRVDDSVFKRGERCRSCSAKWERDAKYRAIVPKKEQDYTFGPALGCKKPKTRMDLAICWETPIDPVYEPRRSTHIDGSEGGLAPAIFALIQHTPAPRNREKLLMANDECDSAKQEKHISRCCCSHSCDDLLAKEPRRSAKSSKSNSAIRVTERKCVACREKQELQREKDPRLIRSAVGIALGLEKDRKTVRDDDGTRRSELSPGRITVPRPRTPFARRTFCIDTLSPPFSVKKGCRDTDYPEHWRLMSMYQQSYRNPHKRKTRPF
ncbi:uncharacterized protein LOC109860455 [Pseudomyrmex gracilis]|uniref:uncharacterized protein LOC109860455 n=1 Tax=Pseudomyrmex gracilis TaxID=219809 RepID=UPI0009953364|nr:uncharacterized protein LOC109860455 [Pseudomyrmex gracilis]